MEECVVKFENMSMSEKQAWADFNLHELNRHLKDVRTIRQELKFITKNYGITPRKVYIDKWIEVIPSGLTARERQDIVDTLKTWNKDNIGD